MKSMVLVLETNPPQAQRLQALQAAFAEVCNALGPLVQEHRCWNRVALHHLAYKGLREKFPNIGSQMICNAIYAVSRTGRVVFQHPSSPYHHTKLQGETLPRLRFAPTSPVYFDRHTLSLKDGMLSLFTLEGRMHFQLRIDARQELNLREMKLREVMLARRADGVFELMFKLGEAPQKAVTRASSATRRELPIPEYLQLEAAP